MLTDRVNRLNELKELLNEEQKSLNESVFYNSEMKKNMEIVGSKLGSLFRQKQHLEKKYLQLNELLRKYIFAKNILMTKRLCLRYENQEFSLSSEQSVLSDVRVRSLEGQIAFHKIELRKIQDKITDYRCLVLDSNQL